MSLQALKAPEAQGAEMMTQQKINTLPYVRVERDLMKQIKVRAAVEEKTIQAWADEVFRAALIKQPKKK